MDALLELFDFWTPQQQFQALAVLLGLAALTFPAAVLFIDGHRRDDGAGGVVIPLRPSWDDVDHTTCEADGCDLVLCSCDDGITLCPGAVEASTCIHHQMLCETHQFTDCLPCAMDRAEDLAFDAMRDERAERGW